MNSIDTAIQFVKNTVKEQLGLELVFREESSVNFFPQSMKVGDVYEINYNRDIELLLWLYNMVFYDKNISSLAITHYLLYYACMDKELYDKAALHLQDFEEILAGISYDDEINDILVNQLSFIMLHEIFHIIFKDRPDTKEQGFDFERRRQNEIKKGLAEMFKTITPEKLIGNPKVQSRIKALDNSLVPKCIRTRNASHIAKNLVLPEDYEKKVLGDDNRLLEELVCDRSAWQFIMGVCRSIDISKEEMFYVHLSLLVALTAVFVDNAFMSYYFPNKHHGLQYDDKAIVIRQNSFKRLDIDIPVEYTKEVSKRYQDITVFVEGVFQNTINSFMYYTKELNGIYEGEGYKRKPDNEKRKLLENKMEKVIDPIWNIK